MAGRAEVRLRPAIGFITEDCPWSPMVTLCTFCGTYLALVTRTSRLYVSGRKSRGSHCGLRDEVLRPSLACRANEEISLMAAFIHASPHLPGPDEPAGLARVFGPGEFRWAIHDRLVLSMPRGEATFVNVTPNAELTGRRRMDALPARCRIDRERLAGKAASRWRSG